MGVKNIEVPTYNCTYCNHEAFQLNQIKGHEGGERFICGECMIKAFDTGLQYEPKPKVSEPLPEGPKADTGTPEAK